MVKPVFRIIEQIPCHRLGCHAPMSNIWFFWHTWNVGLVSRGQPLGLLLLKKIKVKLDVNQYLFLTWHIVYLMRRIRYWIEYWTCCTLPLWSKTYLKNTQILLYMSWGSIGPSGKVWHGPHSIFRGPASLAIQAPANPALGWRALKTPTPETPHFGGHVIPPMLQYIWPRPPGVWLGGPGCKSRHSGWS